MESNYKEAYYKEWDTLQKRNFENISRIRKVIYDVDKNLFRLNVINKEYILECDNKTIKRSDDGYVPTPETGVMILNYLSFTEYDIENRGKWISLKEIPNGGMMFYPAFYKTTITKLINNFGYDVDKFIKCAEKLGGEQIKLGDVGYIFNVFPKVRICLVIWQGDDEIEPNATVLFDSSIQFLMHIESIIGLGSYLVDKIIYQLEK